MSVLAGSGTLVLRPLQFPEPFRLIPRLETNPAVVSLAQTPAGKILLLILFGVILACASHFFYLPILLALSLITAFPAHRRLLVTLSTLAFAGAICWRAHALSQAIDIALVCILGAILFSAAARFPLSYLARRPLLFLIGGYGSAILLVSVIPADTRIQNGLWGFLAVLGLYLAAMGYSLLDARSKNRDPFFLELGTYRAFWGMPVIPYPKGAAYLRRVEAKNPQALAVSHIKGLKLLAWSLVLFLVWKSLIRVMHGYLGIPTYASLFAQSAARMPFPVWVGWVALISAFFEKLLKVCWWGHQIIAICRMAGFQALRNTWRPLQSHSIADFWNRYIYYFKELLVDFFFYPAFMRYFKRHPRLRLFAATFAAACLGNAVLHFFTSYVDFAQSVGLRTALLYFQTYLVYSAALAIGIGISQLRGAKRKTGLLRGRIIPTLCVVGFFCILYIFDDDIGKYPVAEHFRFLGHLLHLS